MIRAPAEADSSTRNATESNYFVVRTVTGISTLPAMTLLTEKCNIDRFGSPDKLASYAGLIPNTDFSGEKDTTTGITDQRKRTLRHLIIESSWIAVRKNPVMIINKNK